MSIMKKTVALGAGSLLVVGGVAGAALATPDAADAQGVESWQANRQADAETGVVQRSVVEGSFAWTQTETASNEYLKRNVVSASRYLCDAEGAADAEASAVEDWVIEVKGAVRSGFSATFAELAQTEEAQSIVMGCACAGNPADGLAAANAEVTGFSVARLIALAEPTERANTVVFTSSDGYEAALPLRYLMQHACPLVFDVNGSPLASSVGGANQLWLGSTAASYFVRDVTSISLEERETPPASPHSDEAREAYGNLPNIGVLFGGEVR